MLFDVFKVVWCIFTGRPWRETVSDWCLVGNIVQEHQFGEFNGHRKGTKQFARGTKVYCLPAQWGDEYEKAIVVGLARRPRRWITVVMKTRLITNWRAKVVYNPEVRRRLRDGFKRHRRQWRSEAEVLEYVEVLRTREGADPPPFPSK